MRTYPGENLGGLYVITERRGLDEAEFLKRLEGALRGGADMLELREKNVRTPEATSLALKVKMLADKYEIPLIINDAPDVALRTGAAGVHLGEHDPPVSEARKILKASAIIGISAYNSIERALRAEAEGADYVAMSSPYKSVSKPYKKLTPPDIIREAKKRLRIPLFVIGGITAENVLEIMRLGVDGVAVMSGIFSREDTERATREIKQAMAGHSSR